MSLDRFYFPENWQPEVTLTGSEAHHLIRVLRKQVGDEVELFNGQGEAAQCSIRELSKKSALLTITATRSSETQSVCPVILAVAAPKGDRFRLIVEKATELGVAQLIPIETERTVVSPRSSKLEKLEQTVIAACKQCGRNTLMHISQAVPLGKLSLVLPPESRVIIGSPQAAGIQQVLSQANQPICIVVGPEGGLSDVEETRLVESGAEPVQVSPHILRVETAAIALAAAVLSLQMGK